MPFVVGEKQIAQARDIRELLAAYGDIEDLVSIGAYKEGTKPMADRAIKMWGPINEFLAGEGRRHADDRDLATHGGYVQ